MVHAYLDPNEKKEVLELVVMVIMYDYGYQKVKGLEGLTVVPRHKVPTA